MSTPSYARLEHRPSVCLVTEELSGIGGSGGIGAAFYELAVLLAARGALVDVLYCPVAALPDAEMQALQDKFSGKGIKLSFLDEHKYVEGATSYEKRSYAVYRHLEAERAYDFVHFHDYKGLGFFSINAKRQGLAFADSRMVVQLHGPTRWTIEANQAFFIHEDQLKIDFLERKSIENADIVVSPSQYLVDWLREHGFVLPAPECVRVLKNVCSEIVHETARFTRSDDASGGPVTDLVLFARHEDRKGFAVFCDALDLAEETLAAYNVSVTFMGKLGSVHGQPSGVYLVDRSKNWSFNYRVRTNLDRSGAAAYFRSLANPVAVVPSPYENSPYTVLETVSLGVPLISSVDGGGHELIEPDYRGLTRITAQDLAAKIEEAVKHPLPTPKPALSLAEIENAWLQFHAQPHVRSAETPAGTKPKVALAITHFERPLKLVDAIISAVRQTYANLEIIVVDDGSKSPETVAALAQLETFIARSGGRLIRRENGYLGAARNTALAATDAEYICFLDDDDYALPEMIEAMVDAALVTGADVVNCMNVFMQEAQRSDFIAGSAGRERKVSYVPMGGPLAIAVGENVLGAATALLKVSKLREIGGYTELKGVGHEDYELFLRMLQAGARIEILPKPLYFYEVGRPSMLSRTSLAQNFRRCYDAVDMAVSPRASQDLYSLMLGKKVATEAHNRQWWLYSQAKTAEKRHKLMGHSLSRTEALGVLIKLSQAEGCLRMAMALAEDLQTGAASPVVTDELVVLGAVGSQKQAAPQRIYDARLASVKLDAALGRGEQALSSLVQYVEETEVLSHEFCTVAREALKGTDSAENARHYLALLGALGIKRVPRALAEEIRGLLVVLEIASGRGVPVEILRELVAVDETAYAIKYADVANAVATGQFRRAAEHFARYGLAEGREGFHGVARVSAMLADCKAAMATDQLIEMAMS